jgi:hypothetical protein
MPTPILTLSIRVASALFCGSTPPQGHVLLCPRCLCSRVQQRCALQVTNLTSPVAQMEYKAFHDLPDCPSIRALLPARWVCWIARRVEEPGENRARGVAVGSQRAITLY